MAAHTPGPWMTTCRKTGGDWELHDPTGRLVGTAVEMEDARLVAAAPQLLAALKELRLASLAYGEASDAEMDAAFARLLQARNVAHLVIAKAEGR